ncbi:MAG: M28 family peptidase [Bacteroidota bacterium]
MKKTPASLFSILFISCILALIYFTIMPRWVENEETALSEFSTKRALDQVTSIASRPHYIGSENHAVVADYLESELKKLGLETHIQEGTTFTGWGNLVKSKNIIARIKGSNNSKALLLLSHYDSAPHSYSLGASDNASGVATILEGVRTFLYNKTPHKNDIIILFSDAEELGLNGAALFVTQNKWAKEIGLALNFEARGTGGPSYMLMEVNQGNATLVNGFSEASPQFPVSNSLMYSIYKMLPNDTDLTVFREGGKIQGFNFAFIDDHFNYHTSQDNLNHLSQESLEHQGTYLIPMLNYFSNANLKKMDSSEDYVYFSTPFAFVSYPFSWILPMWIAVLLLFLFLVFVGIGKRVLVLSDIAKGFLPFFYSMLVSGAVGFLGWKTIIACYPQYKDILQGFTYNGHDYIGAFIFLSLAIGFLFYRNSNTENLVINHSVAPLFVWICINFAIAFYLPGASFFIIPTFFSLLMLAYFVITQKTHSMLNLILSIPTLIIIVPFIIMFPIGLGLKILFGTAVLTILVLGLLLPVLGQFSNKIIWSILSLLIAIGFFINADVNSDYQRGTAKPNSLLYILDADKNQATWTTYDVNLDYWTKKYLGNNPKTASVINPNQFFSKYNSQFTYTTNAPVKNLAKASIEFLKDSLVGSQRYLKIKISPNRNVNRYDVFANEKMVFHNLKANEAMALGQKGSKYKRKGRKILSYYVVNNEPLLLQFSVPQKTVVDMELMESSFDLMTNPQFKMDKRASWMMPMPFVLTDAVVIKQKIKKP